MDMYLKNFSERSFSSKSLINMDLGSFLIEFDFTGKLLISVNISFYSTPNLISIFAYRVIYDLCLVSLQQTDRP